MQGCFANLNEGKARVVIRSMVNAANQKVEQFFFGCR